jgi:hypothetical protein
LIECGISLRGAEQLFEVFNHDELQAAPSFTGIRKWLGKIGVYELKERMSIVMIGYLLSILQ